MENVDVQESDLVDFIKSTDPLPLDPALDNDHLQNLLRGHPYHSINVRDEVEEVYSDLDSVEERLEMVDAIKNPHNLFGNPVEEE